MTKVTFQMVLWIMLCSNWHWQYSRAGRVFHSHSLITRNMRLLSAVVILAIFCHLAKSPDPSSRKACQFDTFVISMDYAYGIESISKHAVSSIEECLMDCKRLNNVTCVGTNYYSIRSSTSPMCELLRDKKSVLTRNSTSLSSVYPMYYAERTCLTNVTDTCTGKHWSFEYVPKMRLQDIKSIATSILAFYTNLTMEECLRLCLTMNHCKAVIMKKENGSLRMTAVSTCQVINVNRHCVRNPSHYFKIDPYFDLFENNCADEMSGRDRDEVKNACVFSNQRTSKRASSAMALYDHRMNGVQSDEHCKQLCTQQGPPSCRAYSFDHKRRSCFMSHSRPDALLNKDSDSFLALEGTLVNNVTSTELEDCVQFNVTCGPSSLTVTVLTSRMFRGRLGLLDNANSSCIVDVDNEQEFQLTMDYDECKIKREASGVYSTVVSLKYGHTRLITYKDRRVKLICRNVMNKLADVLVTAHLNVKNTSGGYRFGGKKEPTIVVGSEPTALGIGDYRLRILDTRLQEINKAQSGQEGFLEVNRLQSQPSGIIIPRNIIVTNLVASDGQSGAETVLLDDQGCPVRNGISSFEPIVQKQTWRARIRFHGFNEPAGGKMKFTGSVLPCSEECMETKMRCKGEEKEPRKFPTRPWQYDVLSKRTAVQSSIDHWPIKL